MLAGYQSHPEDGITGLDLMRWRISCDALDFTTWSEERTLSAGGHVTYNHLMRMRDEGDRSTASSAAKIPSRTTWFPTTRVAAFPLRWQGDGMGAGPC